MTNTERTSMILGWQVGSRIAAARCCKREPATAQWETLWEGEVVTEAGNSYGAEGNLDGVATTPMFAAGEGIRVTLNGVSCIFTASSITGGASIGNDYLHSITTDADAVDDGGDLYFTTWATFGYKSNAIYTREPGTYTVKIERALFAPLAYLYNGVRLPKLPEWDVETYPYAVIEDFGKKENHYVLILCKGPILPYLNSTAWNDWWQASDATLNYTYKADDGDWWGDQYEFEKPIIADTSKLIWTNTELTYADGTLYLSASEPVPVYE